VSLVVPPSLSACVTYITRTTCAGLKGFEKLGSAGIRQIRITDISGITRNPDGTPSSSPGVSVYGVGLEE
jgi:hypothetical protein